MAIRTRLRDPAPGGPTLTDTVGEVVSADAQTVVVSTRRGEVRLPGADVVAGPGLADGDRTAAHDEDEPVGEVEAQRVELAGGCVTGHVCRPHSTLSLPDQRPARGSSPSATGRVHGAQPMEA